MPPLRKGAATQQRMAAAMLDLVQVHGYAGTGLNAVLDRAGAPRGSLYFHFPDGKEELGERAVRLAAQQFEALIVETIEAAGASRSVGDAVAEALDAIAALLESSDFRTGCPVSVVTLEMGAESERLRTACEQAYASWTTPLARFLVARGHDAAWAEETASATISLVEGAMIVARARRDVRPLRDAATTLRRLFDTAAVTGEATA